MPFGGNHALHVVLLVGRLKLREHEQKGLFLFLSQEALGAISEEIHAILILEGDRLAVASQSVPSYGCEVCSRALATSARFLTRRDQRERRLPDFSLGGRLDGQMPFADVVRAVTGLVQLSGKRWQIMA